MNSRFSWTVVGAGPAGILAVGRLLDAGVSSQSILWIDPEFKVGDLGKYWFMVPGNTRVEFFTQFLTATKAFNYANCPQEFSLTRLDQHSTCLLSDMVKPLQWVTDHLCEAVCYEKETASILQQSEKGWNLQVGDKNIFSSNVILALGATQNRLHYPIEANEIALHIALNPMKLKEVVKPGEHVVVFGSSHSGVLVMKNLLEAKCCVTNFYQDPLRYAVTQQDHTLYDNTGLKGTAAQWAKEHLQGQRILDLTRRCIADCSEEEMLQACDHVVYATGFSARHLPSPAVDCRKYDAHTGIIAPGLFGLGIAYPELVIDRYGVSEWSIGLFKFSNYLTKVLPLWMQYTN